MLRAKLPLSKLITKKRTYLDVIDIQWYHQKKIGATGQMWPQATFVLRSPSVVVASPSSWCPHCRSSWQSEQQSHWCPWRNISWNHRYLCNFFTTIEPKVMEVEGEPMSFRMSIGWFFKFHVNFQRCNISPPSRHFLSRWFTFPVWWDMFPARPWMPVTIRIMIFLGSEIPTSTFICHWNPWWKGRSNRYHWIIWLMCSIPIVLESVTLMMSNPMTDLLGRHLCRNTCQRTLEEDVRMLPDETAR